jgi:hypothetical protein
MHTIIIQGRWFTYIELSPKPESLGNVLCTKRVFHPLERHINYIYHLMYT